ncbi:uncharacterized protein LOC123696191 [Colias croceus]|uniref:uncharacterized protein LOC123696191 n=1 Tax=Colias crocea TaxID=72248 RepID=UPI001E2818BD|nr:uncharacterized protein LOC123696191 [Colias croceus]
MSCEDVTQDMSIASVPMDQATTISIQQFSSLLESKFENLEMKLTKNLSIEISAAMDMLKKELNDTTDLLFAQVTQMKNDLCTYRDRINKLESENSSLHSKLSQLSKQNLDAAATSSMLKTIKQLQSELNERDQVSLLNDVEVYGIPEFEGESATHIAITLAKKLGITLEERDIVCARRIGPKRRSITTGVSNDSSRLIVDKDRPTRTRPITISFARRSLRDELLKNARVRRGTSTSDLGLPNHDVKRVHLHERLTHKNRVIFGKARALAKTKQWRFIWTRDGKIYARQSDSSNVYAIRSEEDIESVFTLLPNHNPTV